MPSTHVTSLELDLDVFAGPFDLLLSLILREELDLLEVELAEVVLAYLDHLEARDELDLESATEFLVLIAALLELKSRLMLPGEEIEELDELAPAEAAEELLERMLAYARFRGAGGFLAARRDAEQGALYRSAPLPPQLRRAPLDHAEQAYDPAVLGAGARRAPAHAAGDRPAPHRHAARVAARAARRAAQRCCAAARSRSTTRSEGADRMTVAVTLFALLELYKRGEADWEQDEAFGPITVRAERAAAGGREGGVMELERQLEALLFLSPDPVAVDELADALRVEEDEVIAGLRALASRARGPRGRAARARRRLDARLAPRRRGGRAAAARAAAHARPHAGAGRDALDRRLPAAGLAARGGADPRRRLRVGHVRAVERGLIEEAGRSQFGAVLYRTTPLFLKLFGLRSVDELPDPGPVGSEPRGAGRVARPAAARGRGARGGP